jgi:hypothetical protein
VIALPSGITSHSDPCFDSDPTNFFCVSSRMSSSVGA